MSFKPRIEIVPLQENAAYIYRNFNYDSLDVDLHSHEEYEITLIETGQGKRIIGKDITHFSGPDLVMIGPQVPHVYRGHEDKTGIPTGANCHVIHLNYRFFDNNFFRYSELKSLDVLQDRKQEVIQFSKPVARQILPIFKNDSLLQPGKGILMLLELLRLLSEDKDYIPLENAHCETLSSKEKDRAQKVYKFILDHYCNDIKLYDAAELVGLSRTAFCNYFKRRTGKSFSHFVAELRIKRASILLRETNESVLGISYQVGFNNLSYFNRLFRKLMHCSPLEYRNYRE